MATTFESTTTRRSRMQTSCRFATAMVGRLPDEPTQELLYDRADWPIIPLPTLARLRSLVSLLVLWQVPFPASHENAENFQALGSAVSVLTAGWSSEDGGYPR